MAGTLDSPPRTRRELVLIEDASKTFRVALRNRKDDYWVPLFYGNVEKLDDIAKKEVSQEKDIQAVSDYLASFSQEDVSDNLIRLQFFDGGLTKVAVRVILAESFVTKLCSILVQPKLEIVGEYSEYKINIANEDRSPNSTGRHTFKISGVKLVSDSEQVFSDFDGSEKLKNFCKIPNQTVYHIGPEGIDVKEMPDPASVSDLDFKMKYTLKLIWKGLKKADHKNFADDVKNQTSPATGGK